MKSSREFIYKALNDQGKPVVEANSWKKLVDKLSEGEWTVQTEYRTTDHDSGLHYLVRFEPERVTIEKYIYKGGLK